MSLRSLIMACLLAGSGFLCLVDAAGCAEQESQPRTAAAIPTAEAKSGSDTAPTEQDSKQPDIQLAEVEGKPGSNIPSVSVREGEDWPEFLGPRKTGVSGETGLLPKWPAGGPPVVWKKRIGTGYSAPSVRGNRLVVHHRPAGDEIVECFEASSGRPLWKYPYPSDFRDPYGYNNGPRCTPLLTEKRCYTFGAEGKLLCLNLETGKKVWERDTAADFEVANAFFGVGATPILEDNLLLVMVGGHPTSGMVAFDADSGKTIWQSVGPKSWPEPEVRYQRDRPPQKLASYSTPICATIHGKRHLLCLMRPGLVSLDPKTGKENFAYWFRSRLHDSVNAARPLVRGDEILLSAAYDVGAALLKVNKDGKSYETVWRDEEIMQNHWSTSIEHEGFVYGFSGRHKPGSFFRCIDWKTAKQQWEVKTPESAEEHSALKLDAVDVAAEPFGRGSLIQAEGKFIVLGEGGVLALVEVNPKKYVEISRVHFPEMTDPSWAAPVLSRKRLYLRSEHHLLCLDLAAAPEKPEK